VPQQLLVTAGCVVVHIVRLKVCCVLLVADRFCQMMWRLNFLVIFCCIVLQNSYMPVLHLPHAHDLHGVCVRVPCHRASLSTSHLAGCGQSESPLV